MEDLPATLRSEWQASLEASNKLFRGAMLPREEFDSTAMDSKVGFTPSCLQNWLHCHESAINLLTPEWQSELSDYDAGAAIADTLDNHQLEGRHPLDKAQYVWIKTMLEGQILTWGGDRVDMANSMEARPAFLDHHLAKFATQVPPQLRINGSTEKYVLREAMKGLLPKSLYERQKFAFMAPPAHTDPVKWDHVKTLISEVADEKSITEAGYLDYSAFKSLLETHEDPSVDSEMKVQHDAIINHVLGVQYLHNHFVKQDIPKLAEQKANELSWKAGQ